MTWQTPNKRWMVVLNLLVFSGLLSVVAQVGTPRVPDALKVPNATPLLLKAHGEGVQIYDCKNSADAAGQFKWVLKAPEADLIDEKGKKIGKHYGGPTWEANDGSKVVGELLQHVDAPSQDGIPWLLLKAKSNEGPGTFKNVTYIQRLETEGGKPPVAGCDSGHPNAEVRVHYTANYYFYGPSNLQTK